MLGHYAARKETWFGPGRWVYAEDGIICFNNSDFVEDPAFEAAYAEGRAAAVEYRWRWRVNTGIWAAVHASRLEGDFVECGVNYGFLSTAIMRYLHWETVPKTFYLLDTFRGLDASKLTDAEKKSAAKLYDPVFEECYERVRETFARYSNVRVIRGSVPDTLPQVQAQKVAYLSLDMNCSEPQYAALQYFWPRMSAGGVILLDDYGHRNCAQEKARADQFAQEQGVKVMSLPTGQGLLMKS